MPFLPTPLKSRGFVLGFARTRLRPTQQSGLKKKNNMEILEPISSSKEKNKAEAGSIGVPKKSSA